MSRIPVVDTKEALPAQHHAVWESIVASRGRVAGPWPAMLHVPPIAGMVAHLGALLRFDLPLPGAIREMVILVTVREVKCLSEWAAHAPLARKEGVSEQTITAIRDGRAPDGLTPEEAEYATFALQVLRKHRVDDATFQNLEQKLGQRGLLELTGLIGYYCLIGTVMDAFEIPAAPGGEALPE